MRELSRRQVMYGAAIAAGSVFLGACSSSSDSPSKRAASSGSTSGDSLEASPQIGGKSGSAAKPLPAPASFHEAPGLSGLPPVGERLPKNPLVLPHNWAERGKYGGVLHVPVFGTTGMANASSCHEYFYGFSPMRWLNDGLDVGPGVADRWTS
ncbi:MAG TPA: twin-arginine translocation signal domain-containing protein, partial [Mycobacteriales bacterium]|nr:twin-arginine translocation signal domain-containing protein [Mycobacteriales bacterium]